MTGDVWVCGLVPRSHIFFPVAPVRTWGGLSSDDVLSPQGCSQGGCHPALVAIAALDTPGW